MEMRLIDEVLCSIFPTECTVPAVSEKEKLFLIRINPTFAIICGMFASAPKSSL